MQNSTAQTLVLRSDLVSTAILEAGEAMGTVLAKCQYAAKIASTTANPAGLKLKDHLETIMVLYKEDLDKAGHNVKALFKDALTLCLAPATPVSLEIIQGGKKVETHKTALEAVDMPKHAMQEAAKQVREANGMARATGGGRKPVQPTTAPAQATPEAKDAAFSAWLANLPVYLKDVETAKQITGKLNELGLKLQKAR
jgi:hypothetical protein